MEDGFADSHGRNEFGTPDAAAAARDAEFVRVARVHVHDIGHEGKGSELIREGAAEEPEVGEIGVGAAEVVKHDGLRDVLFLHGGERFKADAVGMFEIFVLRIVSR